MRTGGKGPGVAGITCHYGEVMHREHGVELVLATVNCLGGILLQCSATQNGMINGGSMLTNSTFIDEAATVHFLKIAPVRLSHRMKPGARVWAGERRLRQDLSTTGEGAHGRP
jgi:hypothetical protein